MFRFGGITRKYEVPYKLVRREDGDYNADGVYEPTESSESDLRGVFQPLGAKYLQAEGGKYTADDRHLYTRHRHAMGDVIAFSGQRYRIADIDDRQHYSDIYQYIAKRVSSHDPI
ncbi:hypothetical protein ACX1C1_03975 [Paenibacillus sp. strain BS8-2]